MVIITDSMHVLHVPHMCICACNLSRDACSIATVLVALRLIDIGMHMMGVIKVKGAQLQKA